MNSILSFITLFSTISSSIVVDANLDIDDPSGMWNPEGATQRSVSDSYENNKVYANSRLKPPYEPIIINKNYIPIENGGVLGTRLTY